MFATVANVVCLLQVVTVVLGAGGRKGATPGQKDICLKEVEQCKTWFLQWHYQPDKGTCAVIFTGCSQQENLFKDEESCMKRCAGHRRRRVRNPNGSNKRNRNQSSEQSSQPFDQAYQRPLHPKDHSAHPYQRPIHLKYPELSHQRSVNPKKHPEHPKKYPVQSRQRPEHPEKHPEHPKKYPVQSRRRPEHPNKHSESLYQRSEHFKKHPEHPKRNPEHSYQSPAKSNMRRQRLASSQNVKPNKKNICAMEIERCKTWNPRWYFNRSSGTCTFETDGCNDNVNSFPDENSCLRRCVPRATSSRQQIQVPVF